MCGNNNGVGLDDTLPYNGGGWNQVQGLLQSQMLGNRQDLWTWYPPASVVVPTLPPYVALCPHPDTLYNVPILNNPDAIDITDSLVNNASPAPTLPTLPAFLVPVTTTSSALQFSPNQTFLPIVPEAQAVALCNNTILNSSLARACAPIFALNNEPYPTFVTPYVNGCAEDTMSSGISSVWISAQMQSLQNDCANLAMKFSVDITNTFCPTTTLQPCSGNGICVNNTCRCSAPYEGQSCSISSLAPPSLSMLAQTTCDVRGVYGCPANTLSVSGTNFLNSQNLSCKFNGVVSPAMYMGSNEVLCQFPTLTLQGTSQMNIAVSVSNDQVLWSNSLTVTYFDSNCLLCNSAASCIPNPTSCTIAGVCYANGAINFNNPCQLCNHLASSNSWSYTYAHSVCWPQFSFPVYSLKVVGQTPVNAALVTVSAVNPLVVGDANNSVTYSVNSSVASVFSIRASASSPNTAVITTARAIDVTASNAATLPSFFQMYATDSRGNVAVSSAVVTYVAQNLAPVFNTTAYGGSLSENATLGSIVTTVVATPGSVGGPVTYQWAVADPHFSLNSSNGVVTLVQPLDYAVSPYYLLQVQALDPSGQFSIVSVRVNVTYIPKPATAILLSVSSVDEGLPANSQVINLTSVDPGSPSHVYTISPSTVPFYIVGNSLYTNATLNFETGLKSYTFNVTTTDEVGLSYTQLVTLTVTNVIEPPSNVAICAPAQQGGCSVNLTIPDDTLAGQVIGAIKFTNPDNAPVTCVVYPNNTYGVVVQNGVYNVVLLQSLDYQVASQAFLFPVCSVVNHVGAVVSTTTQVIVPVQDKPNAPKPANLTLSPAAANGVSETLSNGATVVVGTVTSQNSDASASNITFLIVSNGDASSGPSPFQLSNPLCQKSAAGVVSCSVQVLLVGNVTGVVFNASGYGSTSVTVRTVDSASGKFVDTVLTVPVLFVNQAPLAPTWEGSNSFTERSPVNTTVGVMSTNDVHPGLPQLVVLTGPYANSFGLVQLTNSRRSTGPTRWAVVVMDPTISAVNSPTIQMTVNVTNFPPVGSPMWALHPVSMSVTHQAITVALTTPSATVHAGGSVSVNEHTPLGTVIGSLGLDNWDMQGLASYSFALATGDSGFFQISNGNLARTSKNLDSNVTSVVNVVINTSFVALTPAGAAVNLAPFTLTTFSLNVQQVTTPPAIVFAGGSGSGSSVSVSIPQVAPGVLLVASFQVTNLDMSALHVTISNDPQGLFSASYVGSLDTWQISLVSSPLAASAAAGTYGVLTVTAVNPSNGRTATGTVSVSIQTPMLAPGNNIFDSSLNSGPTPSPPGSSSLSLGVVIGVVVGVAIIALVVVVVVMKRRKQALKTAAANEPFYSTAGAPTAESLNNPMYHQGFASNMSQMEQMGQDSSMQNPMYAWYRPDMSRQECEEFLVDQVEGAFVIRDSTATPGWHMLAVKTHNAIVHEKIKMSEEGMYELLPSAARSQPRFREIGELVEHYSHPQDGIKYALALDNPLYDNGLITGKRQGGASGAWTYQMDPSAPVVPLKAREKETMQRLVESSGDELYTNAEQAKTAISNA